MNSREFAADLLEEMNEVFAAAESPPPTTPSDDALVIGLLRLALTGELEASEIAGSWVASTGELDAKAAFARQCGDEMRHYGLITERLRELGDDLHGFDPLAQGYSPLYRYLAGLRSTAERAAAGLFTGEAIAVTRNRQFMAYCRAVGDDATADLYEQLIHPDEIHHHELGRDLIVAHAVDEATQTAVREAFRSTLAISDELRELQEKISGVPILPVS